jgi:hypothetical protein
MKPADISRIKKKEYLIDKINELAMNTKNNIRHLYSGINQFKRGYQPRNNLSKDENDDLLCRFTQHYKQMEDLLSSGIECA